MSKCFKDLYDLAIMLGATDESKAFFVPRKSLKEYLRSNLGLSEQTVSNHLYPSRKNGMIRVLTEANMIHQTSRDGYGKGWMIFDVGDLRRQGEREEEKILERRRNFAKDKLYHGEPKTDDGWHIMTKFYDDECKPIFIVSGKRKRAECVDLKISRDGVCKHKANFWIRVKGKKLVDNNDKKLFEKHWPKQYEELLSSIDRICMYGDLDDQVVKELEAIQRRELQLNDQKNRLLDEAIERRRIA